MKLHYLCGLSCSSCVKTTEDFTEEFLSKARICHHLHRPPHRVGDKRIFVIQRRKKKTKHERFFILVFMGELSSHERDGTDSQLEVHTLHTQALPTECENLLKQTPTCYLLDLSPLRIFSALFLFLLLNTRRWIKNVFVLFFCFFLITWWTDWPTEMIFKAGLGDAGMERGGWAGGKQCQSRDPSFHIPLLFFVFSPLVHQVYTAFCSSIVCFCVFIVIFCWCYWPQYWSPPLHVGLPGIKSRFTISTLFIICQVD